MNGQLTPPVRAQVDVGGASGEHIRLIMPTSGVCSEAQFRKGLAGLLMHHPAAAILQLPSPEQLPLWAETVDLRCFDPYGAAVAFPDHFADLTMWVMRVEVGEVCACTFRNAVAACAELLC